MKMPKLLKFILVGYIFAQIIEFQFNVLITQNYSNWIFTLFAYPILLLLAYLVYNLFMKIFKNHTLAELIYLVTVTTFNVITIEWIAANHSPWSNSEASQIGLFSFHAAVIFMPVIFIKIDSIFNNLKHHIASYITSYAIVTTLVGLLIPVFLRLYILTLAELIGYAFLSIFYIEYFVIKFKMKKDFRVA